MNEPASQRSPIGRRFFTVSHLDPMSGEERQLRSFTKATVGRNPGARGLVIGPHDETVSARSFTVELISSGLLITNTSSFAEIELTDATQTRYVFSGEQFVYGSRLQVVVEGIAHRLVVRVVPSVPFLSVSNHTDTQRIVDDEIVPPERRLVLACLCAPILMPSRFERNHQRSSQISKLLRELGEHVSTKEIDNKIQRTKEKIETRTGLVISTREDLAQFLVRKRLISMEDIAPLLGSG